MSFFLDFASFFTHESHPFASSCYCYIIRRVVVVVVVFKKDDAVYDDDDDALVRDASSTPR